MGTSRRARMKSRGGNDEGKDGNRSGVCSQGSVEDVVLSSQGSIEDEMACSQASNRATSALNPGLGTRNAVKSTVEACSEEGKEEIERQNDKTPELESDIREGVTCNHNASADEARRWSECIVIIDDASTSAADNVQLRAGIDETNSVIDVEAEEGTSTLARLHDNMSTQPCEISKNKFSTKSVGKSSRGHRGPPADTAPKKRRRAPAKASGTKQTSLPTREAGENRALLDELQYVLDGVNEQEPADVQKSSMISLAESVESPITCKLLIAQGAMSNVLGGVLGLALGSCDEDVWICSSLVTLVVARNPDNAMCFDEKVMKALIQMLRRSLKNRSEGLKRDRDDRAQTTSSSKRIRDDVKRLLSKKTDEKKSSDEQQSLQDRNPSSFWCDKDLVLQTLEKVLEVSESARDCIREAQGFALLMTALRNVLAGNNLVVESDGDGLDATIVLVTRLLRILELSVYRNAKNTKHILEKSPSLITDLLSILRRKSVFSQKKIIPSSLRSAVLKTLINLTNDNKEASQLFSESGGLEIALSLVANEVSTFNNFDLRILGLCLLVNVANVSESARQRVQDCYVNITTNEVLHSSDAELENLKGCLQYIYDMLRGIWKNPNQSTSTEMECKVTVAYLCLLLGSLMRDCPANTEVVRAFLPDRSLGLFRDVLAEFLEFHQEAGIYWESMDEAYESIIAVFDD